ncbi:hypothetical protein WA026_016721 [Henosepilachna vigintioctopunctata]|uniref:Peptidase M12B propeptide domain-containing protein n=1 Tax=Henosepilachna vigintioctopunctata TaxID=420089 RepID=A0AAW1V2Y2_9CUCU
MLRVSTVEADSELRFYKYRENSYLESLGLDTDIEYIKPMKISPLPLHDHDIIFNKMNNYSDELVIPHHSGHFRHSMVEVWDPHPNYEIAAFGRKLRLQLAHDNKFIAPNLYVSHVRENYTHRAPQDEGMLGCFYSGNVRGDSDSDVVVSLCNGMNTVLILSEA